MTSVETNQLTATPGCLGTVPFRQGMTSHSGESMNQSDSVGRKYWTKPLLKIQQRSLISQPFTLNVSSFEKGTM